MSDTVLINDNHRNFLNLLRLPARLTSQQTVVVLGLCDGDLPLLRKSRVLEPLGDPAPNAPKYYHAKEVQELGESRERMEKVHKILERFHFEKNRKWRQKSTSEPIEAL